MFEGFVYINNVAFPYPSNESGLQTRATIVDNARMASGLLKCKKIGEDMGKVELQWRALTPEQWSTICKIFDENFVFNIRYFDMVENDWIEKVFYVGDRSARPFKVDVNTGRPELWLDCQANVIDTGASRVEETLDE